MSPLSPERKERPREFEGADLDTMDDYLFRIQSLGMEFVVPQLVVAAYKGDFRSQFGGILPPLNSSYDRGGHITDPDRQRKCRLFGFCPVLDRRRGVLLLRSLS
jgi:hypothetical protein